MARNGASTPPPGDVRAAWGTVTGTQAVITDIRTKRWGDRGLVWGRVSLAERDW